MSFHCYLDCTQLSSKLICVIYEGLHQLREVYLITHILYTVKCAVKSVHRAYISHRAQYSLSQKLVLCVHHLPIPTMHLYVCLQASWSTLRAEFVHLNPAQLHHMLREYNTARTCPPCWMPSPEDSAASLNTCEPKYEHTHTYHYVSE